MEVWKDVSGYNGVYQVSNLGRVRSANKHKSKILKGSFNNKGYCQILLCAAAGYKRVLLHVLIARTFIPNPHNLPVVNHINSNPKDNQVWNLEWCSQSHNQIHSIKSGRANNRTGSGSRFAKITELDVLHIVSMAHLKPRSISNLTGFSYSTVFKILSGQTWVHTTGFPKRKYPSQIRKEQQSKSKAA